MKLNYLCQLNNKTYILFLLFLLLLLACDSSSENKKIENIITASGFHEPVKIDGRLSEEIWQKAEQVVLKNNTGAEVQDSTLMTWVKTCYNDEYLYISFVCNDPDIWGDFTDRDQHLWTEEAIEVFIDTDDEMNTYVEIEVSPNNVLFDAFIVDPFNIDIPNVQKYNLKGFKSAVTIDGTLDNRMDADKKWTVEMAIPLKELITKHDSFVPEKIEWKINFYRINRDIEKQPILLAWSPTNGRFHKPSVFGTIKFIK